MVERLVNWVKTWGTRIRFDPDGDQQMERDLEFTRDIHRLLSRVGRDDLVTDHILRSAGPEIPVLLKTILDKIDEINEHLDEDEYKARMQYDSNHGV